MGKASEGPAHWRGHVERYLRGGLSRREYCQRHKLALGTFDYWRRRLRSEGVPAAAPSSRAVEVVRVDLEVASAICSAPLEVVVGNGRTIRVPIHVTGRNIGVIDQVHLPQSVVAHRVGCRDCTLVGQLKLTGRSHTDQSPPAGTRQQHFQSPRGLEPLAA